MRLKRFLIFGFSLFVVCFCRINGQEARFKSALYINSYGVTYSWGDSVATGIIETFKKHPDIILYVEYIDTKRFGTKNNQYYYNLFKNKYQDINFDVVITSDNAALEFLLQNKDSIAPNAPVAFCGINNPEDYNFENTPFYGIKEGVDLDSVICLIFKVMPGIKNLYFIVDSTETSLSNLAYAKRLESKYRKNVNFKYISNISIDSLYKISGSFEPESAIALMDIFQDKDKTPVNSDLVMQKVASLSNIPIFMDSETSFGKGILGGIINNGNFHGQSVANLALKFIDSPGYIPPRRVAIPQDHYYFDYNIVNKYNIDPNLIPAGSIIINQPESFFKKYYKYFITFVVIILILIITNSLSIINIRRRKKVEKLLKDSENKLKEAQQIAKIGHWHFMHEASLFHWSDEVYRIFGQSAENFKPTLSNFLNSIHPDDKPKLEMLFGKIPSEFSNQEINYRIISENKELKYIIQKTIFTPNTEIKENRIYGTIQDITEDKLVEIELDKYRNQLEKLVSERTADLVSATLELQKSMEILANQKEELNQTIEQLNSTREQLVHSEKLASLGIFTAGIAHEINNPINFISSGIYALFNVLDSIYDDYKDSSPKLTESFSDIQKIRSAIETGIEKTTSIISSLRNYAHFGNDFFTNYDITVCINDALLLLNNIYKNRIEIEKECQGPLEIECIPGKINQVFINLINNSVQSIDNQGKIWIKAFPKNNHWVEIEIKDTGCGIKAENLSKIFDPFFTTKETGKGTGLGLYIVHGIINQHGGNIKVESKPDNGTIVRIVLPIKQLQ